VGYEEAGDMAAGDEAARDEADEVIYVRLFPPL